jgi:hypothetical protein
MLHGSFGSVKVAMISIINQQQKQTKKNKSGNFFYCWNYVIFGVLTFLMVMKLFLIKKKSSLKESQI